MKHQKKLLLLAQFLIAILSYLYGHYDGRVSQDLQSIAFQLRANSKYSKAIRDIHCKLGSLFEYNNGAVCSFGIGRYWYKNVSKPDTQIPKGDEIRSGFIKGKLMLCDNIKPNGLDVYSYPVSLFFGPGERIKMGIGASENCIMDTLIFNGQDQVCVYVSCRSGD